MLKRVLSLTRVLIKTNIIDAFSKQQGLGKRKLSTIILLIFAYGYLCVVVGVFSYGTINNLILFGQQSAFISLICLVNVFRTLFETVFTSANILYFSKDNEYLLPLPLQPFEIVAGKLNTMLAYSYFSGMFFGLIPLFVYGYLTEASIVFYLFSLIVVLILPVIPMLLSSLIMMVVMSFVNLSKHKGLFQTLSIILVVALSMSVSLYSSSGETTPEQMLVILNQADGLAKSLYPYFPTLKFASEALINLSFVSLLLLVVTSVALYVVMIAASNKLYFKGVVGNSTTGSYSKKKVDKKDFVKADVAFSYIAKEFKCLIRKPVYFTQCVLPGLILPVIMAFSFMQGVGGIDKLTADSSQIATFDQGGQITFSVLILVCLFLSLYTYVSITAVSRDGNSATFMKYIPVPFYQQLIYKCVPDMLLTFVPNLIVFVCVSIVLKLPVLPVAFAMIVFAVFAIGRSFFGIIIDCKKPKHNFTSEYQVVKSNFSIFYIIVYNFVLMIPSVLSLIYLSDLPLMVVFLINLLVHSVLALGLFNYISNKDFKLAQKIY